MIKNDIIDSINGRRSIKKYIDKQISDEELDTVLEAGKFAPTGRNRQSPVMVAIRDREIVKKLSKMNADVLGSDGDPFYGAPCVVVVFADMSVSTGFEDACLVLGNLMNAAHAIGLGSCWIHRAREMFSSSEGKELMKKWGLSENFVGVGNCILGYRDGDMPAVRPRKENYVIKID
ncbi:MAG: nitroreductase family protein [Ruminococcaceae bacterium]|nr:nitroreductase family protein [Oscillospiraceae bacterium]